MGLGKILDNPYRGDEVLFVDETNGRVAAIFFHYCGYRFSLLRRKEAGIDWET
jgi:hypothetical protein